MRTARFVPLVLLGALAAGVPACAPRRPCVPAPLMSGRGLVDVNLPAGAHAPPGPGILRDAAADFRRRQVGTAPPGARPYQFLALSGGGLYGAFGAGVLIGWEEAGTRPRFDAVTGVSVGGLMATFAFLGPRYDHVLYENLVGIGLDDLARRRPYLVLPYAESLLTSRRLAKRIGKAFTPQVIEEVAAAHAAGRRLYVATTDLDSRRLVIWDMGAIAARGTPDAHALYRQIVLASGSVPGVFPPVRIPVEIDGKAYEELHVDGATSDSMVFRSFMVADLNRANGWGGSVAPPGSTLYIVSNGKLYADPSCVSPRIVPQLNAAFRTLMYGKGRDECYRIFVNCLKTGVEFRLTAIPQDVPLAAASLQVDRAEQQRLLEIGRQIGREPTCGGGWRDLPPGTDPSEQVMPRAGTVFVTGSRVAEPVP